VRKLDHKTLEAIGIRAVEQVQAGNNPEEVIRALGFFRIAYTSGFLVTVPAVGTT